MIFFHLIIPLLPRSKFYFVTIHLIIFLADIIVFNVFVVLIISVTLLVLINFYWLHPSRRYLLLFLINFVTIFLQYSQSTFPYS